MNGKYEFNKYWTNTGESFSGMSSKCIAELAWNAALTTAADACFDQAEEYQKGEDTYSAGKKAGALKCQEIATVLKS